MSNQTEYEEHYQRALKAGQKNHRQHLHNGTAPYLPVLDEILSDQNDINEDTRMRLELIEETLTILQTNEKVPDRTVIKGFTK